MLTQSRPVRAGVSLVSALAVLVSILALVGVPAAEAARAEAAAPAIPKRLLEQDVYWGDECPFSEAVRGSVPTANISSCAFVSVPMDWNHPDDPENDITLAIAYTPASGKSKGLLVSNPGGPGAAGQSWTALLGVSKHRLLSDFDLLGFDPRGFGLSQNVTCTTTRSKLDALPTVVDYRERTRATHAAEIARAKLYSAACASSEFAKFVTTQQTVYDMEFLRVLLDRRAPAAHPPYKKINYVGYSYGTWLGTWYADTYPSRVGRFVLDSNMNWTTTNYNNQRSQYGSFQRRRDAMFFPWLARHSAEYKYGTTTRAVKAHYEATRAALVALGRKGQPVPTPTEMDGPTATAMYSDASFRDSAAYLLQLDEIVKSATASDMRRKTASLRADLRSRGLHTAFGQPIGVPTTRTASYSSEAADEEVELDIDKGAIVRCNDTAYPRDVRKLLRQADLDAKKYPFIGYFGTVNMCSYWPHKPTSRTVDLKRVPRMLMVQSEGDPATRYEGARTAHRRALAKTRLISVDNDGQHGVYIVGSASCAQGVVDGYLFAGRMPAKDRVCATTTPLPGDSKVFALKGPLNAKGNDAASARASELSGTNPELAEQWADARVASWR